MNLHFSFIIPVYNRPEEIKELLESFSLLDFKGQFEIVIVEDGSTITSEKIVNSFKDLLSISYYTKTNSGPGASRNFGMQRAKGNYFIILDSDCLLPSHYLTTVQNFLSENYFDCYGGADAAHNSFSNLQKAINYVMTSFLTTGGIRGNKNSINRFEPRSFNMGISKEAFVTTGGFAKIHPGEDPDLSQRILKAGFTATFLPNAYVYHKRRISWKKFYTQVRKFGMVRPILNVWHPKASKITFWFPTLFVVFVIASVIVSMLTSWMILLPLLCYLTILITDASIRNSSLQIGLLSVIALFVQFFGYGLAFLESSFYIQLLKRDPEKQFPDLFFK
ncbi:cellulose synthase/poly-beta-1,6-N-acetylglucosamine synthase-like glycosyltransferase [Ulvibacter sp. MAR_2010_11]|uniref:glycosyltransferase n=1 Tax=Ulvibacter sp. MAR_2010_11 TaxID=1250229 RepID=UPI000C2B8E67|nr:glycosyltransferase [Ulvibacter sp. MAR_2010_11]PKA84623.1 cellulose synthase/poly-beta-1,6-N-acetylglucosamine synthase-like glycosyltransferase [Ulvibacter sp. MAR_2010_11]